MSVFVIVALPFAGRRSILPNDACSGKTEGGVKLGYFLATLGVGLWLLGPTPSFAEAVSLPSGIELHPAERAASDQEPPPAPWKVVPAAPPPSAYELEKREQIWGVIRLMAKSKNTAAEELRRFVVRFLAFFPQADNPHRAVAEHILQQLNWGVVPPHLDLAPPLPRNGLDYATLRLLFARGVGGELGLIGVRQGYFAMDALQVGVSFPLFNFYFGSSLGVRLPLGASGRDEFRLLLGISMVRIMTFEDSITDMGVGLELSYIHRFYEHLGLQVGVKTSALVIECPGAFFCLRLCRGKVLGAATGADFLATSAFPLPFAAPRPAL